MSIAAADVIAGQAVYTEKLLRHYDFIVLGFSNRFAWKCPSRRIVELYNKHVSANHLDVGVGTGYFLDRCKFPSNSPRLALLDLNPSCLAYASNRLARYHPVSYRGNILEPLPHDIGRFDSIGLNYVLHCLPGTMDSKAVAFRHLAALLNPRGVIFGSTILFGGVSRNGLARAMMEKHNANKIFCNKEDDLQGLRKSAEKYFSKVTIDVVGCVALFSLRNE
jgi:2-polyprenyl-3-methyl-5-hydroxy-6-metoxy-1,4-benzoquinol methylase